jgi:DNA-binding Lrp family transcriptional regulator
MTNGTWTLTSTGFNYLVGLQAPSSANILSSINIISTIEDGSSTAATDGTTNLTIAYQGSTIYAPSNQSVSAGSTTYSWDIDATTSSNGTYVIEEFWTNGTEAGYRSIQIIVYYPTSLVAASTSIQAYTEDSFEIRVDYTESFGSTPLNDTEVTVEYSYDSGSNVSLTDSWANGTWTASISTIGEASGAHTVVVYAEGFAVQNQSLTIDVILTHETLPLTYAWSAPHGNNISYFENTTLTVWYRLADGTNITGATLNITYDSTTWDLVWNPTSEGYSIQLNGTDFVSVPDTFNFTAKAWKLGHEYKENDTITLIVREAAGTSLTVFWTPSDLTLSYVGHLRVVANYSYEGLPISDAFVRLTFNGSATQALTYNASDMLWYIIIPAEDIDLGTWDISLRATRNGYTPMSIDEVLYVVEDTPTLEGSWSSDAEITDYDTPIQLNVTITDSQGAPIINSTVTVTLQGTEYNMTHIENGIYNATLIPEPDRGSHEVVVTITEYGFVTSTLNLNLTILAVTVFAVDSIHDEYQEEELEIAIDFRDSSDGTDISWGIVNLTVAGTTYIAEYTGTSFIVRLNLTLSPNFYQADIFGEADGCRPAHRQITIEVLPKTNVSIAIEIINPLEEGGTIGIQVTLTELDSGAVIQFAPIHFEVWVNFDNGTVIFAEGDDSTNEGGIALWQYTIPTGVESRVEDIDIRITFVASEQLERFWDKQATRTDQISINPLIGLFYFFIFEEGIFVVIALVIATVAAITYNKRVKPKKRAARVALQHQLSIFRDLEAMQHFMAVYVDRGTCVFYHPFRSARIQADLISGFISAVTSVYGEISGEDGVQGTLEEIHYQGLRLNSYSGRYVLGILILEKEISPLLRDRLQFFIEMFENEYESHLEGWTGIVDCFDPEWIVSNLMTAFGYSWVVPHVVDDSLKMDGTEKKIVGYIKASLGEKLEREFSISEYLKPIASMLNSSPAEVLDIFLKMEEKGIINPISIHSILQRQGLGLSGVDELIDEYAEVRDEVTPEEPVETPPPEETTSIDEPEVTEEASEPEIIEEPVTPEQEPEEDPRDQFLADVESLLKKEKGDESEENSE